MLTLYLLQSTLPLVLIAWLAFVPPRSVAGFWIQATAIGVVLVAISRVGIMSFPPYWSLYVFSALLVSAFMNGLRRHRNVTRWPGRLLGWLSLTGFAVVGLYTANLTRVALAAASPPKGRMSIWPHRSRRALISSPMAARRLTSTLTLNYSIRQSLLTAVIGGSPTGSISSRLIAGACAPMA